MLVDGVAYRMTEWLSDGANAGSQLKAAAGSCGEIINEQIDLYVWAVGLLSIFGGTHMKQEVSGSFVRKF